MDVLIEKVIRPTDGNIGETVTEAGGPGEVCFMLKCDDTFFSIGLGWSVFESLDRN